MALVLKTSKLIASQVRILSLPPGSIEKGYDPKMGARPMRRVVQKNVENIVAAAIISGRATPGSTLHITPDEINIQ